MPTWLHHVLEYVACGVAFAIAYHSLLDNPDDYIGFPTRRWLPRLPILSQFSQRTVRSPYAKWARRRF